MKLKNKNKLILISIPIALALYIFYLLNFKSENSYTFGVDEMIQNDSVNENPIESRAKFTLKKFGPKDKNSTSSIKAITRNPFKDLESAQEAGVNLPNNVKFTGIAQVGRKKGVMVSTPMGMDIFYVGQQVSDGFKIVFIDTKNAEVILSNGSNQTLVKLEQD